MKSQSVLNLADELKQWALRALLIEVGPPEKRAEYLEMVFQSAVTGRDDESARTYYQLLVKNFEDMGYQAELKAREKQLPSSSDVIKKIENEIDQRVISKTIELYVRMLSLKTETDGSYFRESEWQPPEEATLLETKKAMLEKLVSLWRHAMDLEKSDKCFLFFFTAFRFATHHREEKMITELLREATPDRYPAEREARAITLLPAKPTWDNSFDRKVATFMTILGNAWLRNSKKELVSQVFTAALPLLYETKTEATFPLLEKAARCIAEFDAQIRDLLGDILSCGDGRLPTSAEFEISYLDMQTAQISIRANANILFCRDADFEKEGNIRFAQISGCVLAWQRANKYRITLQFSITRQYSPRPLFERSQDLWRA